jgi:hypothetical protein
MKSDKGKIFIDIKYLILAAILFILPIVFDLKIAPSKIASRLMGLPTPTLAPTFDNLETEVTPSGGYTVDIDWGETGKKLVESGAINLEKYKENYKGEKYNELLSFITNSKNEGITINRENAYFWVNTLWALGLTQKSDVLSKGVMGTEHKDRIGNFASTGGWILGSKDAVTLYSSSNIIPLSQEQQDLVAKVSANIYRPCCGNPTSFPDCNHGMAILGLLEIMASQGKTESEMYEAALAFNSYWFAQTYIDLAYYFQTKEGLAWENVDPKKVLSAEYSSAQGYQNIKEQIGNIPGTKTSGASCGA